MIPRDFIDTLLARIDIVDVVDRRVPLKKAGQNYQACCPFHNEKTPSFTVSPTKQFYHCFGCGAHGTAIGFLMEYEGMAFPDAVAALAQDAGLAVPVEVSSEPPRPKPPPALWDALEVAARFYRSQLKQSPRAIDYLKNRGLTGEIAAKYGIGYAPDGSPLKLAFEDYGAEALATSGLVVDNDDGRRYDRFRDRIMFPIRNGKGQIIGFGGRVLDKGEPKYLNSPETPLFHKGSEIYGLWEARAAIKAAGEVIVAEGYMDAVALAQHGVGFAVATLGTSTTPVHARILLRHADRLTFAFDGDNAGRKAAWRALENTLEALQDGKQVRFAFFPEGDDPDSYIRANGRDAFLKLLDAESLPLSAFFIRTLTQHKPLDTTEGRAALLKQAAPLLDKIAAPLLAGLIRRELAEIAGLSPEELTGLGLKASPYRRPLPPGSHRRPPSMLRSLAQAALMRPGRVGEITLDWLAPDDPGAQALRRLLEWLPRESRKLNLIAEDARGSPFEALLDSLTADLMQLERPGNEQADTTDPAGELDWDAEFEGALRSLRDSWRRRRLAELGERPLASLNPEEKQELASLARS